MSRKVIYRGSARDDLVALHRWIRTEAGNSIADNYLRKVDARMKKLADFPLRGTPRDEIVSGARSLTFEGRLLILYRVHERTVEILRVVSTARDLPPLLRG